VLVPLPPWATDTLVGDAESAKLGESEVSIVYVAVAMALVVLPVAAAMASIVSVEETAIGPVYSLEFVVGVVPFVV